MNEELRKLYEKLQSEGSASNLPSYEKFEQTLVGNPEAQKSLYDNLKSRGVAPNLPEFNEFQSTLFGEKEPLPQLPDTSQAGQFQQPTRQQTAPVDSPNRAQTPKAPPSDGSGVPEFVKANLKAQNFEQQARDNMVAGQDQMRRPDPVAMDKAKRFREERDRKLKALDTGQSRFASGVGSFMQALGNTLGQETLRSLAVMSTYTAPNQALRSAGEASLKTGTNSLYNLGTEIGNQVKEIFPNNPAYQEEFLTSVLPSGAGSMSAFLVGGVLGKGIKLTSAVSGVIGSLSVSGSEYNRALENGATADEALGTWMINLGVGGAEAIPIFRSLKKLDSATKGGVKKVLQEGFEGGMEELVQEVGQNIASNTTARAIYDEQRRILEGVAEGGAAGFILGAFMRGMSTGIGQAKNKVKDAAAKKILEQAESKADEVYDKARPGGLFSIKTNADEAVDVNDRPQDEFVVEEIDLGGDIDVDPDAEPQVMLEQLQNEEARIREEREFAVESDMDTGPYDQQLEQIELAKSMLAETIPGAQREVEQSKAQETARNRPITPEAQAFVNKVNDSGSTPGFITNNLRRIARENGIPITEQTHPQDVVDALQQKSEVTPEQVQQSKNKPIAPDIGENPQQVIGEPSTDTNQLSVAFKTGDGEVYVAPRNEAPNHVALYEMHEGVDTEQTDGGGFMTPDGRYLSRQEASQYMQELKGEATDEGRGVSFSEDFMQRTAEPEQYEVLGGRGIVEYDGESINVMDITGREIPPNDARHTRAVAEFFATQSSPAGRASQAQGENEIMAARRVAQESSNPVEIANALANIEDIQGSADTDIQNGLRERFQEVTGVELSPQLSEAIQARTQGQTPTLAMEQGFDERGEESNETIGSVFGDRIGENLTIAEVFNAIDGGEYFGDMAMRLVEDLNKPKSRSTIVYMTPQDYLDTIDQMEAGNPSIDRLIDIEANLEEGGTLDEIPMLTLMSTSDGGMQVTGNDGMHEVMVLNDMGVRKIPVQLTHPTFRWGDLAQQAPDGIYDFENSTYDIENDVATTTPIQSVFYPKDITERNIQRTGRVRLDEGTDAEVNRDPREDFGPAKSTPATGGKPQKNKDGSRSLPTFKGALDREAKQVKDYTKDPVSLYNIIRKLIDAMGVTVRQDSRLGDAMGTFNTKTGAIASKDLQALEVITHEIAHHIEYTTPSLQGLLYEHSDQLMPLKYESAPDIFARQEGFAEWFRIYIGNPAAAKKTAPEFHDAFEKYLKNGPEDLPKGIFQTLQDIRAAYAQFRDQPSDKAVDSMVMMSKSTGQKVTDFVKENRFSDMFKNLLYKTYKTFVGDDISLLLALAQLKDIHYRNTGKNMEITPLLDFYKLNRVSLDSYSAGAMDIEHGVENYHTLNPEGPSIRGALSHALGEDWSQARRREFSSYLVARRAENEWVRYYNGDIPNRPVNKSEADIKMKIKIAENQEGNENWREAADMMNQYNRNMFKKLVDAGLITKEVYDQATADIPFYVPFFRRQQKEDGRINESEIDAKRNTGRNSLIKRYDGSDRDIVDPIESMMRLSYQFNNAIKQNDTKKALFNMINKAGIGSAQIGREIDSKQIVGKTIKASEIRKHLKESQAWQALDDIDAISASIGESMLDNLDFPDMTMFRQEDINEAGRPVIYAWDKGKRRAMELNNTELGVDIYNVLASQPQQSREIIANVLSYPASILRTGITTEPSFFAANLIRDQVSAWILTDVGIKPGISITQDLKARANEKMKGFEGPAMRGVGVDEKTQQDYSRLYRSWSGISTFNVQALDPKRAQQEIEDLKTKNITVRRLKSVRGMSELLDLSEIGTRLSVFQRAFRKAKANGMTDKEAAIEAGFEARDLIDFGRHGSSTQYARRLVPFLNAAIQGLDKGARVLSGEGSVFKAIKPFLKDVNDRPLDSQERAKLELSKKAWLKVMEIGSIGAMLAGLYADDPDYDEIPQYLKSTHWIVPDITAGDDEIRKFAAIPKPFELAVLSNVFESAVQGYSQEDPQWGETMKKSITDVMVPPVLPVAFKIPAELFANKRTFDNRPIVYQRLKGLEPWRQYNAYTSELSKALGKATNTSPAMIEHTITGVTGTWGRVLLSATSMANPEAPTNGYDDTWFVRRFIRSSDRGNRSSKRFYELAAQTEGTVTSKANTFKTIAESDSPSEALEYFSKLDDWEKGYVAMKYIPKKEFEDTYVSLLSDHPFDHARKASQVLSTMRRELFGEQKDPDEDVVNVFKGMDPDKKADVDDIIDRLGTAYLRNALIASNEPRSAGRKPMDIKKWLIKLQTEHPQVLRQMNQRFNMSNINMDPQSEYDEFKSYISTPEVVDRLQGVMGSEMNKLRAKINAQ